MELEKTTLYHEVIDTFFNDQHPGDVRYEAALYTDTEGTSVPIFDVEMISTQKDYLNNTADEIGMQIRLSFGNYAINVYPYRTTLRVGLKQITTTVLTSTDDNTVPPVEKFYCAVLIEEYPALTQMQGMVAKDIHSLDQLGMFTLKLQLFDIQVQRLRATQVGDNYRQVPVQALIQGALAKSLAQVKPDPTAASYSVDVQPVDNTIIREQIPVKHGVNVLDLPNWLQNKIGVYASGLGSYIDNQCWYVYRLYDTTRFNQSKRTLSIYVLPPNRFPEIEKTYSAKDDGTLSILSIGRVDFRGDNDIGYISKGNGVRYAPADVIDQFTVNGDGKAVASGQNNTRQFLSQQRGDGLIQAPVKAAVFTANPFTSYSELAQRKGGMVRLQWRNSKASLLTPGMPVRIIYYDKDDTKQTFGVLLAASEMAIKAGGVKSDKYTTNAMLQIFANLEDQTQ